MQCAITKDPKKWWSFKFKGPAFRHEIGVGLTNGWIVWASKGYPAGRNPDITIFRKELKQILLNLGEMAIADKGYRGEPEVIDRPDAGSLEWQEKKKLARSRHETVNGRIKKFNVMGNKFRHDMDLHDVCFDAVVVIVQLNIENGEPLFEVDITAGDDEE